MLSPVRHFRSFFSFCFTIRVFGFGPKVSWIAFSVLVHAIAVVQVLRLEGGRWRDSDALESVMAELATRSVEN